MDHVTWTEHARRRCEERSVSKPEVELALLSIVNWLSLPDGAIVRLSGQWGGVVARKQGDHWLVVTVVQGKKQRVTRTRLNRWARQRRNRLGRGNK
jgi:hypothetical protein